MDRNLMIWVIGALIVGGVVGYFLRQPSVQPVQLGASPAPAQANKPAEGFTLHIDAERHFPGDDKKIAHHYCKQVAGGWFECQLYDSDDKDARLVGTEMVVPTDVYNSFDGAEKAMWHYHKEEIPKVNAKLPDLSEEEGAKVAKSLEETYGKIYLFWDPSQGDKPVGSPRVYILP